MNKVESREEFVALNTGQPVLSGLQHIPGTFEENCASKHVQNLLYTIT